MKKLKKILRVLLIGIILLSTKVVYAATASQEASWKQIGNLKYICIGGGVVLILLVLWISYKSDKNQEGKENQLEEDDDYDDEEEQEEIGKEQSLYESFRMHQDEEDTFQEEINNVESKPETIEDFQLDEIFNEDIQELEFHEPIQESYKEEIPSFEEDTQREQEPVEGLSLEDDFLRQMNQNLPPMTFGTEEVNEESQEIKEEIAEEPEEKVVKKVTARKTATKKTTKAKPETKTVRKTTKKAEEPEEKTTKKVATKKTTTKKVTKEEPETVKKTTRKTKKVEEPEKKTAKKTTKKTTKTEESTKKTTKKTTRKKKDE